MRTLARWSVRHRAAMVAIWLVGLIGLGVGAATVGGKFTSDFSLGGTDSQAATDLLKKAGLGTGDSDSVVVRAKSGSVTDPAVRQQVEALLATLAENPAVKSVVSPYTPAGAAQVSRTDPSIAYASVTYTKAPDNLAKSNLEDAEHDVADANSAVLQADIGGQGIAQLSQPEVGPLELLGVVFALLVLLLVFRTIRAAVLPILTAVAGVVGATLVVLLLANVISVPSVSLVLALLIGLGVGIDYSLFIVNRARRALRGGASVEDAVVEAVDTSGRAVIFAGITVVIALLGLTTLGVGFLVGMSIGAVVSVLAVMLAAITLLPSLLAIWGRGVLTRGEKAHLAEHGAFDEHAPRAFARWAARVERRPVVVGGVAALLVAVVAVPFFSIRLGSSDQGNNPTSTTTRRAYDLLAQGFGPGYNGPVVIAAETRGAQDWAAVQRLTAELQRADGVAGAVAFSNDRQDPAAGSVAVVQVVPTTAPQDERTSDLITRLRDDYLPATGLTAHVGGAVAVFDDFADVLNSKLAVFIGIVIVLSMIILILAFRSVVVPVVGALLNLLSAGAAFGVVTAVFQWGWGEELIGVGKAGPIESFLPVILFAILFGLSMDYQVFLVSRMHEEWSHAPTKDAAANRRAVGTGLAETGKVVVAAATIMIFVFAAFVLTPDRSVKLFGFGLAAAVLIDAFLIRMAVVPAVMFLLGKRNWYFPAWLRWLPRVSVEGGGPASPPAEHQQELART